MLCPWKPGEGIGSLWTKLQMLVTFHEGTEPRGNFPFTKVLPHKTILFKNYFFFVLAQCESCIHEQFVFL